MIFWIIIFAMALMVSALLILALVRERAQEAGAGPGSAAAYDLQVYRDQLRDIDRDLARGLIGEGDAELVRVEVSRRILAADTRGQKAKPQQDQPTIPARSLAMVLVLVLVAGSVLLYREIGVPGQADLGQALRIELAEQARQDRPNQAQAVTRLPPALPIEQDPEHQALIEQLRAKVAGRPDDLQGHVLLAHNEARSGDFVAASRAQARVLELMGSTAGAREFSEYAELMIIAANGFVSPEAEDALRTALELDPNYGPARYYWGLMLGQIGRPDLAFRTWESTLQLGPPDAPWIAPIRGMIEEMAWQAGVHNFVLPATEPTAPAPLAEPSGEDMEAATDMSAEDQQVMIRGMVDSLLQRLGTEGGSPAEWARLIGALGVLGEKDRAQTIFNEAKTIFADNATALDQVTGAARQAGLYR